MSNTPLDTVLQALQERAKELSCIYSVDEILHDLDRPLDEVFQDLVQVMPQGWQYPHYCHASIQFRHQVFSSPRFRNTPWVQSAPVMVQGELVGSISVCYTEQMPKADEGPFWKEERKLIDTIADRLGQALLHRDLRHAFEQIRASGSLIPDTQRQDWRVILDLLKMTDQNLYRRLSRKMLNYLSYNGIHEAKELLRRLSIGGEEKEETEVTDDNRPLQLATPDDPMRVSDETFRIAAESVGEKQILSLIQVWIKEDRVNFLVQALETADTSLQEIASNMERYRHTGINARELSIATQAGLKTSLVRRVLTDHMDFVDTSRRYLEIDDFLDLLAHSILMPKSHGKLGGKSSGLFLASHIIRRTNQHADLLGRIKIPKTWYIPSDVLLQFLAYNNLDDIYNWKYLDIDQIRQEYPHLLHVFKSSRFSPDIVQQLSAALDDFGDKPLIVRSSSLLEDRIGAAFSGKYKSLFLANQGDKASRLNALMDAIAEVYASVFGPDPIQYRAERGLLDQHEEMGIMIQEVVGSRMGRYFMPAFSGVGFSNNEFRWSPRIKREDGLLRLVPGLGTRAVDRLADDYPVLVAPGQPGLRVNVTPEEAIRYSPKKIDVIDLVDNQFQTLELRQLMKEVGNQFPAINQLVSTYEDNHLRIPAGLGIDFEKANVVFTFEGLISKTPFVTQMRHLLSTLRDTLGTPVDIEFASDGRDFYLLQCRPQSYSQESTPAAIPRDVPQSQILFSANRYVSNGKGPDITHIVYVDPEGYSQLADLSELRDVGRAVSSLNKILPKRQFILMGPGRWGSRGDIKLGVSVTYSDISNTNMLIEIARKQGNYMPDLSFGTHFFQDLVEFQIRYLPLYPDDARVIFKESFFKQAHNMLSDLLPEYADLAHTVYVIDVPRNSGGKVLRVLMNADLDEAVGILTSPGPPETSTAIRSSAGARPSEDHSRWRARMAEHIAENIDRNSMGVKGLYLIGSTKNTTAGPDADIDLIVHFCGTPQMKHDLEMWLDGWSLCLAEMNFLRTGVSKEVLLDVRFVTDEDIAQQTSFAAKIDAVTDAARSLL